MDENEKNNLPRKLSGFEDYLNRRLKLGVANTYKLFLEIKGFGYRGSYATLNRYLNLKFHKSKPQKASIRVETEPGEQAQVDWGFFGKIKVNSKIERLCCFFYLLSYSRALYIEFTIKQNLQTFEDCHIHAFEKLGIPKSVAYDNMKTVVTKREKIYNGKVLIHYNSAFLDFAQYYNFRVIADPPYWPRAKGKVEAAVKYIRYNLMLGMKQGRGFILLDDLNKKAAEWVDNIANKRVHRTTGEKPMVRWLSERQFLHFPKNLPQYETSPFVYRNSTKDRMIQYKLNFYQVPIGYSRKKLLIKEVSNHGIYSIEVYRKGKLICIHNLDSGRGKWIMMDAQSMDKDDKKINYKKLIKKVETEKSLIDNFSRPLNYYNQAIGKDDYE